MDRPIYKRLDGEYHHLNFGEFLALKVGDRVRVVGAYIQHEHNIEVGEIVEVTERCRSLPAQVFENGRDLNDFSTEDPRTAADDI